MWMERNEASSAPHTIEEDVCFQKEKKTHKNEMKRKSKWKKHQKKSFYLWIYVLRMSMAE